MKVIAILFGIVLLFPIVTIDAYGILACTETNIERATRGYESAVNSLNRFVERDFGDLEKYKLTDPKAYEKGLQAAHDSYPNHIQSLVNSETQLLACNVNQDSIAILSDTAYEVVYLKEKSLEQKEKERKALDAIKYHATYSDTSSLKINLVDTFPNPTDIHEAWQVRDDKGSTLIEKAQGFVATHAAYYYYIIGYDWGDKFTVQVSQFDSTDNAKLYFNNIKHLFSSLYVSNRMDTSTIIANDCRGLSDKDDYEILCYKNNYIIDVDGNSLNAALLLAEGITDRIKGASIITSDTGIDIIELSGNVMIECTTKSVAIAKGDVVGQTREINLDMREFYNVTPEITKEFQNNPEKYTELVDKIKEGYVGGGGFERTVDWYTAKSHLLDCGISPKDIPTVNPLFEKATELYQEEGHEIPEFGTMVMLILVSSIASIVVFGRRLQIMK